MLNKKVRRVSGDFDYVPNGFVGIVVNDLLYPLLQVKWDSSSLTRFTNNTCFVLVDTLEIHD